FGVNSILLRPKSRGSVRIGSRDPHAAPRIDNAFLREAEDLDTLVQGLHIARRILAHPAMERYEASEILPGPELQDDAALKHYMRRMCTAVHHPGGSC